MTNPEAMLAAMLAADPSELDLESRYERLFRLRNRLVDANVNDEGLNDFLMGEMLELLENDFPAIPDREDTDRAVDIITGLFHRPREIEDLSEHQIAYIEDVAVHAGLMRTLLWSYRVKMSDDFLESPAWVNWMIRRHRYMIV